MIEILRVLGLKKIEIKTMSVDASDSSKHSIFHSKCMSTDTCNKLFMILAYYLQPFYSNTTNHCGLLDVIDFCIN